jgi:hypothetical protein
MRPKLLYKNSLAVAATVLAFLLAATAAFAQSSSFTYQGRLTDGGTSANGNYDFQFALWDSLSGGTQVGSTQTVNTVAVSNGVFTVSLDFGANSFPGANRFLEISARPTGGSFTPLTPRQPITSTPYAVRSLNASSADSVPVNGVPAGSANYIQNTSSAQTGNFNISGNGTAAGTLAGSVVNATTQFNIGGSRILSNPGTANLFAGAGAGAANTTGFQNAFFGVGAGSSNTMGSTNAFFGANAGVFNTTGFDNSFFGHDAGNPNTTGDRNAFFGDHAGVANTTGNSNTIIGFNANVGSGNLSNATAIGAFALVDASNALVLGSILPGTNVGIGTTAPVFRLHVVDNSNTGLRVQTNTGGGTVASFGGNGDFQIDAVNVVGGRFMVKENGRVGIGTTAPDQTLTVNGNASKVGGGSWATFSDERLKNIRGRFTSGLKAVMQLQPLRYEYKRENALNLKSEGEHVGFSAQAVQKIIPEAVTTNDKGYLLVNNDPILWTMLNAIKEQQAQIQQQRELIERQRALANRQQRQLNALKKLACRSHRGARLCR